MRRKILMMMSAVIIVLVISGCQFVNKNETVEMTRIEESKPYENPKMGLVVSTLQNPFFVEMKDGAVEQADIYGLELIVLDSRNDSKREQENHEKLIKEKVDVIVLNPTDSVASISLIDAASKSNIEIITIDREIESDGVSSHIASDNYKGGRLAGHYISEQLAGRGNVAQLLGISGISADVERGEGFHSVIEETNIDVVVQKTAGFDREMGQRLMTEILAEYDELDAVFAHNDEMALGALKAITIANRDIIVVGFDGADDAIIAIQDGSMAATVAQQPIEIGKEGIRAAWRLANEETLEEIILVPLKLITRLIE